MKYAFILPLVLLAGCHSVKQVEPAIPNPPVTYPHWASRQTYSDHIVSFYVVKDHTICGQIDPNWDKQFYAETTDQTHRAQFEDFASAKDAVETWCGGRP